MNINADAKLTASSSCEICPRRRTIQSCGKFSYYFNAGVGQILLSKHIAPIRNVPMPVPA
jgi:hypothetical protein